MNVACANHLVAKTRVYLFVSCLQVAVIRHNRNTDICRRHILDFKFHKKQSKNFFVICLQSNSDIFWFFCILQITYDLSSITVLETIF